MQPHQVLDSSKQHPGSAGGFRRTSLSSGGPEARPPPQGTTRLRPELPSHPTCSEFFGLVFLNSSASQRSKLICLSEALKAPGMIEYLVDAPGPTPSVRSLPQPLAAPVHGGGADGSPPQSCFCCLFVFDTGSCSIAQAESEFAIVLPQPSIVLGL